MPSILVVGDIMLDVYSFGNVNRISPEAPVPVLRERPRNKRYVPGGAANTAVNLKAAEVDRVAIFAMAGCDSEGDVLLQALEDNGIATEYIYRDAQRPTTVKHRFVAQNNQQILRVDHEETQPVQMEALERLFVHLQEKLSEYDLILLSDYNKGFLTYEVSQRIIRMAKEKDMPVLVDVKGNSSDKYMDATLLKPNRNELQTLTGQKIETVDDVIKVSEYLCRQAKCDYVLTTLGADGMLLTDDKEQLLHIKSVAQEVYDVTGAGDTSIAYLAAALAQGKDIREAVRIANYAAGVQVSKVGTSIVRPREVEDMMYGRKRGSADKELYLYRENGLERIQQERNNGKKLVFTNGCFDILHAGHIDYLKKAKALGDILVVGVNSDASVKRLKGSSRPVNSLADRLVLLSALECVDYVVAFEEDTPLGLIEQICPDVLVKGGDYQIQDIVGADYVQTHGGSVTTIPFVEGKSTTGMIEKIRKN